jgi:hypothetical protein
VASLQGQCWLAFPDHLLADLFNMFDRARGTSGGKGSAACEVIFMTRWMRCQFNAHERDAYEIGDTLLLNDAHRLFCVPFGHQHQLARDGEALQEQRHFAGHVE